MLLNTVKIMATILREAGWVAMVFPLPFLNSCVLDLLFSVFFARVIREIRG
jgi:hypothetical protein